MARPGSWQRDRGRALIAAAKEEAELRSGDDERRSEDRELHVSETRSSVGSLIVACVLLTIATLGLPFLAHGPTGGSTLAFVLLLVASPFLLCLLVAGAAMTGKRRAPPSPKPTRPGSHASRHR